MQLQGAMEQQQKNCEMTLATEIMQNTSAV